MKIKLILITSLVINSIFAQVGIGTTAPHSSSILDLRSTTSGLLIPRVNITSSTDVTTITTPATSLLIYNLNTVNDVTPGYYYWESKWKKLISEDVGWKLDGNTLTSGNEYIGTKNFYALKFKTNNNLIGMLHPNGGINFGLNSVANPNGSVAIGQNANANTQINALALGYNANAAGFRSTAIGYGAATNNNDGIAIGYYSTVTGIYSSAIGYESSSPGQSAAALGYQARSYGYLSNALGSNTNAMGAWSTAIGFGATTTQDNSIILGNSSNSNNKIGIGTNTPDERLHVVGSFKLVDGNQANGKILTSDANGKSTWINPNSLKVFGEINKSSNQTITGGGTINFGTNGDYQNTSLNPNYIQVIQTGTYKVTYTIAIYKFSGGTKINPEFYLQIWGTPVANSKTYATLNNGDTITISYTKLVQLNAYEAIGVATTLSDNNSQILANGTSLYVELVK